MAKSENNTTRLATHRRVDDTSSCDLRNEKLAFFTRVLCVPTCEYIRDSNWFSR